MRLVLLVLQFESFVNFLESDDLHGQQLLGVGILLFGLLPKERIEAQGRRVQILFHLLVGEAHKRVAVEHIELIELLLDCGGCLELAKEGSAARRRFLLIQMIEHTHAGHSVPLLSVGQTLLHVEHELGLRVVVARLHRVDFDFERRLQIEYLMQAVGDAFLVSRQCRFLLIYEQTHQAILISVRRLAVVAYCLYFKTKFFPFKVKFKLAFQNVIILFRELK